MRKELYKYTPALQEAQYLKAVSVGREKEIKRLLNAIAEGAEKKGNQHFLIIGPRGIGKTHLLLLIYHTVKGKINWDEYSQPLSEFWVPILFAEEEYGITSLTDFLLEILSRLKDEAPDSELLRLNAKLEQVTLPGREEKEQALDYLLKRREDTGKKFLLLLDNLQDILTNFSEEDQGRLRDILMSRDLFMLIATSPTLFDTVVNYEAPFYNFFEIIWLQEINQEQVREMIEKRLRLDGREELLKKLNDYEPRLNAIIHLTGGNPRLVLSLYQMFTESKILEVERDLLKLLDEMTPYFQDRMKSLTPQQRKILDALALLEVPSTPTEVARTARLPVNVVNSQINRLKEAGFLRQIKEKGRRKTLYDVKERLFRMWRQMRVDAGRKRLRFIVKFIEIWFSPEELIEQLAEMFKELKVSLSAGMMENAREITHKLYYIQEALPPPLRAKAHSKLVYEFINAGDFDSAEREAESLLSQAMAKNDKELITVALWENVVVCHVKGEWDREMEYLRRYLALRPDDVTAWTVLGNAYVVKGEYDKAIESYRRAVEIKPDEYKVWYNMGNAYFRKGELNDAVNSFSRALKMAKDPASIARILIRRVAVFAIKGGESSALKDAEKAFKLASEIKDKERISESATLCIGVSLRLSAKNLDKRNMEKAFEHLQNALKYVPEAEYEYVQNFFGTYFKEILKPENREFIKRALEMVEQAGVSDLNEFLKPYHSAVDYIEKKDRSILNRLTPEIREIVEDMVTMLDANG